MCGRYSLSVPREVLEERFDADFDAYEPSYNCAPGQDLPVLTGEEPERATLLQWGFTPSWADEAFDLINARAETIREKPAFRDAFRTSRCVVPADGFYEWADLGDGKRPYRVTFEDGRPFAMAGIHATWEPAPDQTGLDAFGGGAPEPSEPTVGTFAVITTEPNDLVEGLHHRMAAMLDPADVSTYLHGRPETAAALLDPHSDVGMRYYPVSTRVSDPSNDDPSLVEPV